MRFVPYRELDGPNVVVDGSGNESTVLTLSHWPGSHVAPDLAADLSAEIVVRYLERPEHHVAVDSVSNNHFDEDGLTGVWAMTDPETALAHKERLIDVARAGDFGWSRTREAARAAFAISTFVDPERSPLDPSVFAGEYDDMAAAWYTELLPRVPQLLTAVDSFREMWAAEDDHLTQSDAAFERGDASIVEHADIDLAVVTVPNLPVHTAHRFTQPRRAGLHPMAVHNRTERTRLAYVRGRRYSVELRYETWVQFVSRPVLPRPDLSLFAEMLNDDEPEGTWHFDGVGAITPALRLDGASESALEPADFVTRLSAFLRDAPPAWDPWRERH